jgi:thiamine biosynthesis lipoprotein
VTVRRAGRALGSALELLVESGVATARVDAAWSAIEHEFARVDAAMSRFREDSALTRANRAWGPVVGAPRRLTAALALADRAGRVTAGRFDARVLADLERLGSPGVPQSSAGHRVWRIANGGPMPSRIAGERRLFGYDRRTGELELDQPVDLGGIGKGLALRWAARAAARRLSGFGFLVDAGGDVVCRGTIDGGPWSIGIEDPHGDPDPVATCALFDGEAIATSSVRVARWTGPSGRQLHHLIDPATGEPGGAGLSAVTVVWPDPAWAEIWSKALFLAGAAGIGAEARRRGLAAWWVSEDDALSMTPAARQRTSWVRADARRATA